MCNCQCLDTQYQFVLLMWYAEIIRLSTSFHDQQATRTKYIPVDENFYVQTYEITYFVKNITINRKSFIDDKQRRH